MGGSWDVGQSSGSFQWGDTPHRAVCQHGLLHTGRAGRLVHSIRYFWRYGYCPIRIAERHNHLYSGEEYRRYRNVVHLRDVLIGAPHRLMKRSLLVLFLSLPFSAMAAPISFDNIVLGFQIMNNMTINNGTNYLGEKVVLIKWQEDRATIFGMPYVLNNCAETKASEFLSVEGDRTVSIALTAKTPSGRMDSWKQGTAPPKGMSQWCLQ